MEKGDRVRFNENYNERARLGDTGTVTDPQYGCNLAMVRMDSGERVGAYHFRMTIIGAEEISGWDDTDCI